MTNPAERQKTNLFLNVQSDIRLYDSLANILEKSELDGYFELLTSSFDSIFQKEIMYAVCGFLNRNQKSERKKCPVRNSFNFASEHFYIQRKP